MIFKHSMNILTSRFSLVYKSLLYVMLMAIILVALVLSIFMPAMSPLVSAIREVEIFKDIGAAISSVFAGDSVVLADSFAQLKIDYYQILDIFSSNSGQVWLGIFLIILIIMIYMFLYSLISLPVSDVTNSFMNSNSKYGFSSNFIHNINRSLRYSALHTLIMIPYTAAAIGSIWLLTWLANKLSIFLACIVIYLLIIMFIAIKRALFCYWLPLIVAEDMGVVAAFKMNFKLMPRSFVSTLGTYTVILIMSAAAVLLLGIVTFGIGVLLVTAASMVLKQIVDMVTYYRYKRKKYYIDSDTVVNSDSALSDEFRN